MRILTGLSGIMRIEGDSISISTVPSYPSDRSHVWMTRLQTTDIRKVRYIEPSPEIGRILFAVNKFEADSETRRDRESTVLSFEFRQEQAPPFKALAMAIEEMLQNRGKPRLREVGLSRSRDAA
jgi:hypothetical protein